MLIWELNVAESVRTLPEWISRSRRRDCSEGRASLIWRLSAETGVVDAEGMKMGRSGSAIAKRIVRERGDEVGSGMLEVDGEGEEGSPIVVLSVGGWRDGTLAGELYGCVSREVGRVNILERTRDHYGIFKPCQ